MPSTRHRLTFYVDNWQHEKLKEIAEEKLIPQSEQIRQGIDLWILSLGIKRPKKSERRVVSPTRRS